MIRRPILACLLFLTICMAAQSQMQPAHSDSATPRPLAPSAIDLAAMSASDLERTGDVLRTQKDYLQAIDYYKAANKRGESATIHNKLGLCYLALRQLDPAKKAFEHSLKRDKHYPEAYNSLGVVYYLKNDFGKAIKNYRKAIELREDSPYFHSNLGTAYIAKEDMTHGMAEYRRAFELDPKVFESKSRSGITAWMSGPADRAKYAFAMARIYASGGDIDGALQWLKRAMEDGYPDIKNVYKEAEFAKLREDQRFTDLMSAKPQSIQ